MKKFSDFMDKRIDESDEIRAGEKTDMQDKKRDYTQEDLSKLIDKYSTYSGSDLMSEFLKLTMEKKSRGELDRKSIETLKNTLSPMLNAEQKNSLNKILEMIENVK